MSAMWGGGSTMTDADKRIETAAEVLHGTRHRMGTGSTCSECRKLAERLARILVVPSD